MKYLLLLLCIVMLILCIVVSVDPQNEIIKVELSRSGAWSDRGATMSVDKSLNYNFYYTYLGSGDKPMSGYYIGKVNRNFWDTLNTRLEDIDLKSIRDTGYSGSDASYFELIVTRKNGKQRIMREQKYGKSDSLSSMLEWLNVSYKKVHFIKELKQPIKFETAFQNPPKPIIDQMSFPSRTHKKIYMPVKK